MLTFSLMSFLLMKYYLRLHLSISPKQIHLTCGSVVHTLFPWDPYCSCYSCWRHCKKLSLIFLSPVTCHRDTIYLAECIIMWCIIADIDLFWMRLCCMCVSVFSFSLQPTSILNNTFTTVLSSRNIIAQAWPLVLPQRGCCIVEY